MTTIVSSWVDGEPGELTRYTDGKESALGEGSKITAFTRVFNFAGTLYYNKTINEANKIYSQLRWDYEYRNTKGIDQTWYRQNVSWYTHYGLKDRYFFDLTLVGSASNKLAPGHKWAFSPTVGAAWVVSKENFMQNQSWIDFLKVRASFGIINADRLPQEDGSDVTNYWEQTYGGGSFYPFDTNYSQTDLSEWETKRGVKHVGNAISQLIAKLRLNCYWEKTDIRMKPDWLNNSPMTYVEVATESNYIRCLAVPTLIERSDGQGIYCDISDRKRKRMYVASDSLSSQVIKSTKWGLPTRRCRKAMSAGSENSAWQRSSRSSLSVGKPRTWRRGTAW